MGFPRASGIEMWAFAVHASRLKQKPYEDCKGRHNKRMKRSKQSVVGNICIVVFLLISVGFMLYIAKVSPTLKSEIELRKHNKTNYDYLDEEKLSVVKNCKLFEKRETKDNSVFLREIGPIPNGKFVSSFVGEGEGTFSYREKHMAYGKRAIHYVSKEPRRYYDGSLIRDYWGDIKYKEVEKVKYVTGPYWKYETKRVPFKYTYTLTTFDLSDSISSNTPDSIYEEITRQFAGLLTSYKNYEFSPSQRKCDHNAIAYEAKDQQDTPVLRHIYFANQRAYMLELHSEYQLKNKANSIWENIAPFYLQDYNDTVYMKMLLMLLCCISFVVLGVICLLIPRFSLRRNGVSALGFTRWLFRYIYVAWLVNVVCVFADIYPVYKGDIKQDGYWWAFFSLFLCSICMNILTKMYIANKVETKYEFDYLVPIWLKSYLRKRHATEAEYRSVVVFLLYPFFILGNLPLGLFVLGYVLPVSLLAIVLLELRNFSRWTNGEMKKDNLLMDKDFGKFKDYYLLLDIDKGSSAEDVDKAFNRAMAKYNSGIDGDLYNEAYKRNVQEAYRVLSSVNRLRPEYDKEFEAYRASNMPEYQYSDEKTKNDIMLIQKELYGVELLYNNNKRKTYNSVVRGLFVFLILLVIASAILFIPTKEESSQHNSSYHYRRFRF